MSDFKYLHFTLGPVQGFVAQARRTRDLWAGSFLLSYLAGQAMYEVIKAKKQEKIIIPNVYSKENPAQITDPLLQAIISHHEGATVTAGPRVGSLPNRFKAKVPADFNPVECTKSVLNNWQIIAQRVWERYIAPVAEQGKDVHAIWQRQVNNFWDINWVTSENRINDNLLDRRKNWRSFVPKEEPGDKCTLMGNLQELSGYIGVKRGEREKQKAFWAKVRERTDFNLRDDERLCAVALIKRLFPLVAKETIGWSVPVTYPSTSYIAAVPWLTDMIEKDNNWCQQYATKASSSKNQTLMSKSNVKQLDGFKSVVKAVEKHPDAKYFAQLEGNFYYQSILANHRMWPKKTVTIRNELIQHLKKQQTQPSSFYAVLLMDGDRLGALLQDRGKEISEALATFSQQVAITVKEYNGVLIYAGGDDVLVLAPLEHALPLSVQLRKDFQGAFSKTTIPSEQATISAAIIYTHHHAPLKSVLAASHSLLDDVAKEKTGRDSLAIGVWNTAGLTLQWANPWEKIITEQSTLIEQLTEDFSGKSQQDSHYNSVFFYNIRQRFSILLDEKKLIPGLNAEKLLVAEYLKNRQRTEQTLDEAERRIRQLMEMCCRYKRVVEDGNTKPTMVSDGTLNIDGALLIKFLATKGVE